MDIDELPSMDQNQPLPSTPADHVKWQSSQMVAYPSLNHLIVEASNTNLLNRKPREQRGVPSIEEPSASPSGSTRRSLQRTKSYPRNNRNFEGTARSPLPVPNHSVFQAGDPSQFLDMVKVLSHRVDENARMTASKRPNDVPTSKRKTLVTESGNAMARKSALPYFGDGPLRSARILGKQREPSAVSEGHTSISTFVRSSSSSSSLSATSSHSNESSVMLIDTDTSVSSIDSPMTTVTDDEQDVLWAKPHAMRSDPSMSCDSPARHLPSCPPTRMHPFLNQRSEPSRNYKPVTAAPQLLRQHSLPRAQTSSSAAAFAATSTPVPPRPSLSQPAPAPTHRPLGMRRPYLDTSNLHGTSSAIDHALPTRQKAFKPPLQNFQQQQQPQRQQSRQDVHHASSAVTSLRQREQLCIAAPSHQRHQPDPITRTQTNVHRLEERKVSVTRSSGRVLSRSVSASALDDVDGSHPSSSPTSEAETRATSTTDPDSSYGEISFDMDALEETMRMYD